MLDYYGMVGYSETDMPVDYWNKVIVLLLLALGACFFIVFAPNSQANLGITIMPLKIDLSGNPGETLEKEITVSNPNEKDPLTVETEFQDFVVVDEKGEPDIKWVPPDIENPHQMIDWIRISRAPITIPPLGKVGVPFKIVIPRNAGVGGHYAAIFFKAAVSSEGGNLGAIPRVGSLILPNVGGEVKKSGEIVKLTSPRIVNRGPVNFVVEFKNTGTAHFKTRADITIRGVLGGKTILASQDKFMYPDLTRKLDVEWNKKFLIGPYFVKAEVKDGEGQTHEAKTWFIGFPYLYVLIGIGVLYGLWTLWRILKKRFKIVRIKS